jgi:BASS family bile acid:Na+ symporter
MEESILTTVGLPLALAFIMVGMGLSLTLDDFRRIVKYPKAVVLGLVCQLILLPLVGYLLVRGFHIEGALAVGVMIIAACPGGATSNLISHLAKGDTALSISLTAVTSLVTVVTIPLIVNYAIVHFGEEGSVLLPLGRTIAQIFVITLIPVGIGMFIRRRNEGFAAKADRPVRILSAFFLAAVIVAAILKERANLVAFFKLIGPAMLTLNLGMLALGYLVAKFFILPVRQRITISIETGIQNGTLGIFVAATLLKNSTMTIPSAIYSLIMFMTAALVIFIGIRSLTERETDENKV